MHTVEIKSTENGPNLVYLDGKVFTALADVADPATNPSATGPTQKSDSTPNPQT